MLNNKGFTLVEVMVAFVILLFVSLAMMQLGLVSIGSNITNILRDEAVSIADQRLNDLMSEASNANSWGNPTQDANLQANGPVTENVAGPANPFRRSFRLLTVDYIITRTITDLETDLVKGPLVKQINITVSWTWKGQTPTHSVTSIVRVPNV